MAATRSPKYPNFSLRTAVKQAEKIFKADRRNVIDRLVAAKHMGYSGLSGPADKSIATLLQYGLLERVGKGEVRISQLAVDILHPDGPRQRAEALVKAAFAPELFKAIKARFPEGVSPESLQSFLVRENFLDRAIGPVTRAFGDNTTFLEQSGANDSGGSPASEAEELSSDDFEDEDMDAPPSPTIAQQMSHTPAVGPLSVADMQHLPPPGYSSAAFPLAEGTVFLSFPERLTSDGYAELAEYLAIFLKRAERTKRLQEAQDDFKGPPSN